MAHTLTNFHFDQWHACFLIKTLVSKRFVLSFTGDDERKLCFSFDCHEWKQQNAGQKIRISRTEEIIARLFNAIVNLLLSQLPQFSASIPHPASHFDIDGVN